MCAQKFTPHFALDLSGVPSGLSLAQQIAEAIIQDIRRGRLRPRQKLPSSRNLATSCNVHRNTVLAAFADLIAQGYLQTVPQSGTFVSEELPERRLPRRLLRPRRPLVQLHLAEAPLVPPAYELEPSVLPLLGGLPDIRSVPTQALARAYRAALKKVPSTLDYQSPYGQPHFIEQLSSHLRLMRGITTQEGGILVTRGSQQALHLAARSLVRPGSMIAVENLGYPPAWEGFRLAGARLVPIRVDRQGLVVDDLAALCQKQDVAAVYVTPHHQYPTTVTMSGPRRMALLDLARRARFVVIEDDYDHEFHFRGRPVLPLKGSDDSGVVLLVGTLSKVLAPGLRVGYAVGQVELVERMMRFRYYMDRQGDHASELALSYLMEDGELGAHIRRMHRQYALRREALFEALHKHLPTSLAFTEPAGGLAVWCRIPPSVSASQWAKNAAERGVLVQAGQRFFFDQKDRPYMRLGYARLDEQALRVAVKRLAEAIPRKSSRKTRSLAVAQ
jgi:GntR family transcriptional regulator / MocR family aminotransferase